MTKVVPYALIALLHHPQGRRTIRRSSSRRSSRSTISGTRSRGSRAGLLCPGLWIGRLYDARHHDLPAQRQDGAEPEYRVERERAKGGSLWHERRCPAARQCQQHSGSEGIEGWCGRCSGHLAGPDRPGSRQCEQPGARRDEKDSRLRPEFIWQSLQADRGSGDPDQQRKHQGFFTWPTSSSRAASRAFSSSGVSRPSPMAC